MKALSRAWAWLRRVSGDDAYERYVEHLSRAHPECAVPSRGDFCRARETDKWTGINRCC